MRDMGEKAVENMRRSMITTGVEVPADKPVSGSSAARAIAAAAKARGMSSATVEPTEALKPGSPAERAITAMVKARGR
jgi:hypothetical protein